MKEYKINYEVLKTVINYLGTKPFSEVNQIINVLQQSEEIKKQEENKDKKEG